MSGKLKKAMVLMLTICPMVATAWNATGHVLIAQIAYDQLSKAKKLKADALAQVIFDSLPKKQKRLLESQYEDASLFAKTALLPDAWRSKTVSNLFKMFHAEPPVNLSAVADETTKTWHYIDTPYPASQNCLLFGYKNIIWSMDRLAENLLSNGDKSYNAKAVEVVLFAHFAGDIHQPLHTATNVSSDCHGDRGGNAYCLRENRKKCKLNLHALWDSGAKFLSKNPIISKTAAQLESEYPMSYFKQQLEATTPEEWGKMDTSQLFFIYDTPPFTSPSPAYITKAQSTAKYQIALAGYRLALVLEKVL